MPIKERLADSARMVRGYIVRAYSSFTAKVFDVPPRLLAFLSLLVLLAIPCLGGKYLPMLTYACVYAILAVSWDLLVGRTGQVSLGHAFFFGMGAYGSALLIQYYGSDTVTIPLLQTTIPIFLITVPVALAIGVVLAILLGLPALRVKGPYLGLLTLCIPLIMSTITNWHPLSDIFHGTSGIKVPLFFSFLRGNPIRDTVEYYFALTVLFFSAVIIYKVATSKTGIVFVSILDNELAAKACGINVTRYKLLSFVISGLFGTLSGCIYVHLITMRARPLLFDLTYSILPITMTFLGGLGTIYGPLVGAFIYNFLDQYVMPTYLAPVMGSMGLSTYFGQLRIIIFALIVITIIIKWPRGIARTIVDKLDDLAKPRDIEERGPRIWKKYKKEQKESRLQKVFSRFKKKQEEKEVKT
jgi:branched-chain amino acid transport system permease protein